MYHANKFLRSHKTSKHFCLPMVMMVVVVAVTVAAAVAADVQLDTGVVVGQLEAIA